MNEAHRGDVVVLVSCCASGPRYVRQSSRPGWRCGRCGGNGVDLRAAVLGPDGAIPTPERDTDPVAAGPVRKTSDGVTSVAAAALA